MRALAAARANFAFETTLASRSFAPWLLQLGQEGYRVHILFLWLRSAELAVSRIAERVRLGGHDVAADVVRRRYHAGLRNFFALYMPLADSWQMFDNSRRPKPRLIAAGNDLPRVHDVETWQRVQQFDV
jgi:predicted ABC-type ATPase